MHQTISLGAYDRFNYGDLLFPHMLDNALVGSLSHVSITGARLANVGGHDTSSLKSALSSGSPNVILGGGDILTPGWFSVHWQLQPVAWDTAFRLAYKLSARKHLDSLSKRVYGVDWLMPFIPPKDYAEQANVVYHAVGGTGFSKLPEPLLSYAVDALRAARFVSVRDQQTLSEINNLGIKATLAPDSVAALALEIDHRSEVDNRTIAIQASDHFIRYHGQQFIHILNILVSKGYELLFIPIGLTGGHSDLKAFKRISSAVPELKLHKVSSVQDVMNGISSAGAFIGTSLHGHITASAMGIPNIALPGVAKLRAYVETWALGKTPVASNIESIPELLENVLSVDTDELFHHAIALGNQAKANSHICLNHATA